jgi:hypothetical protein
MRKALHDMGSQRESECPATRALETIRQAGRRDRTKNVESGVLQAPLLNRKRQYDMAGMYHAACKIHVHDHDLDFPSVDWCCDGDDLDCADCNGTLVLQPTILENARIPLTHYEKRRKLKSGEAPYLVRTKTLPVGLSLWGLSDDAPSTKTQHNNLTSPSGITNGGGKVTSSSLFRIGCY